MSENPLLSAISASSAYLILLHKKAAFKLMNAAFYLVAGTGLEPVTFGL